MNQLEQLSFDQPQVSRQPSLDLTSMKIYLLRFMGLSFRTYNALRLNFIETIGDLLELNCEEISGFRGMGRKGLDEIMDVVNKIQQLGLISIETISIDALEISPVIKKKLKLANINTLGELIQCDYTHLRQIANLESYENLKLRRYLEDYLGIHLGLGIEKFDEKLCADDPRFSMPVSALCLSLRTTNALQNNDIKTVGDLLALSEVTMNGLVGFGKKARDEVYDAVSNHPLIRQLLGDSLDESPQQAYGQSFYDFMQSACSERERDCVERCYGLNDNQTTNCRALAAELGVSGSRVNQIVQRAEKKIFGGFNALLITPLILERFRQAVSSGGCKLDDLTGLDSFYTDRGITRLVCKLFPQEFTIFQGSLCHEWLVSSITDTKSRLVEVNAKIRSSEELCSVSDLAQEFHLPVEMIMDLKGYKIIDGKITRQKQYQIVCIRDYMRKQARPVRVLEIAKMLDVPIEYARNLLCSMSGVVNIGRSVYALVEYGYSNATTLKIVYNLLKEIGEPISRQEIYDYVQRYREISNGAVDGMFCQNEDVFAELDDGRIALTEWGYTRTKKSRPVYELSAEEAILRIINESNEPMTSEMIRERIQEKFGDSASSKKPTVLAALTSLVKARQIRQLRLSQTAIYMKK